MAITERRLKNTELRKEIENWTDERSEEEGIRRVWSRVEAGKATKNADLRYGTQGSRFRLSTTVLVKGGPSGWDLSITIPLGRRKCSLSLFVKKG